MAHLVEYDLVHILLRLLTPDFPYHTNEILLERHRTERGVEEE